MKLLCSKFRYWAARVAGLCILFVTIFGQSAWPQARTIKLINPFPPGGTADVIARVVTDQIGRTRGVSFVIENRPGAGTVIGSDLVARAKPDSNTLLINSAAMIISANLRKVTFDPLTSFTPICNLTQSPQLLVVNSASPYRSMGDIVEAARKQPDSLTLSSTAGGGAQIGFERFRRAANVAMTYVPYPGNAPTVNAVLGGHVTVGIANYADWIGHLQTGKARAIAAMTPERIDLLPELPTIGEAGYKEFEYLTWFGIMAPAKLPDQSSRQLTEWFATARQDEDVKAKLRAQGFLPLNHCGQEFVAAMRNEHETYGRVIRETNIKAE